MITFVTITECLIPHAWVGSIIRVIARLRWCPCIMVMSTVNGMGANEQHFPDIWPLWCWIQRKPENISIFPIISQNWIAADCWNLSLWKLGARLFHIVNTIAPLITWGHKESGNQQQWYWTISVSEHFSLGTRNGSNYMTSVSIVFWTVCSGKY